MEINGSPWNIIKKIAIVFLIVIAAAPGARAISIHDGAGTAGAAFLKIEGGSRPVGMGGAFAGLANDVNTIFLESSRANCCPRSGTDRNAALLICGH